MRLEKYMDLAHFLLRDDSVKYPKDTFDVWVQQDTQRKINLRKPLPIHVRYFTCEVDTEGVVDLHTDIYLRDERMIKVLYTRESLPENNIPSSEKSTTTEEKKKAWIRRKSEILSV
jgi:murein L,D-transpeptidase YcbB/YkuD